MIATPITTKISGQNTVVMLVMKASPMRSKIAPPMTGPIKGRLVVLYTSSP
jgi:hypothetical protein